MGGDVNGHDDVAGGLCAPAEGSTDCLPRTYRDTLAGVRLIRRSARASGPSGQPEAAIRFCTCSCPRPHSSAKTIDS